MLFALVALYIAIHYFTFTTHINSFWKPRFTQSSRTLSSLPFETLTFYIFTFNFYFYANRQLQILKAI